MSSQRFPADLRRLGGRLLRQGARRSLVAHRKVRSSSRHPFLVLGAPMRRSSRRNLRPDI